MEARRFFLDTANRSFVSSPDFGLPTAGGAFFDEDVESIELYFLKPTGDANSPYSYADYSGNTVKLAVGVTAPAALQTSWSAVSPTITASITTLTTGGGGTNEVQQISFSGNRPVRGGLFFTLPARSVTVTTVSAGVFAASSHGLLDNQPVTLSAFTISGSTFSNSTYYVRDRTLDTFKISATPGASAIAAVVTSGGGTATLPQISTNVLAHNQITASAIERAFVDAGIVLASQPQILVSGSYADGFTVTFANSQGSINFPTMQVASTLAAARGLAANVSFNTTEVGAILAAGKGNECRMEVEVSSGGVRQTYSQAATISSDIIASTSPAPLPVGGTTAVVNFTDGSGGTWALSVDANGIVTTTKL
jgi:hypothetical protein